MLTSVQGIHTPVSTRLYRQDSQQSANGPGHVLADFLFNISQNKNIIILLWILRTSNINVAMKESETLGWKDFKYHFVLAPSAQAAVDTASWSMASLSG